MNLLLRPVVEAGEWLKAFLYLPQFLDFFRSEISGRIVSGFLNEKFTEGFGVHQ